MLLPNTFDTSAREQAYEDEMLGPLEPPVSPEEQAYNEALLHEYERRGELAGTPERLACYQCPDPDALDEHGFACTVLRVVKLGPVINRADPTQSYVLECGHSTI